MADTNLSGRGLIAAASAFGIWGLFPLYLKALQGTPSLQFIAHRAVWSVLFVIGWMVGRRELRKLRDSLTNFRTMRLLIATAALISINWLVYVWGVNHGHVVETSLGYFINPLVNVLLGVAMLSERLNRMQWTAVALAAIGVTYLTAITGHLPWIALTLAFSFGFYGFLRKIAAVDALPGLAIETILLLPVALGYLIWCEIQGVGSMGHTTAGIDALLVLSGPLTAIALVLFAYGARNLPYSTLGLMQYIAPSLQLLCGIYIFHEPFQMTRAIGFAFIWAALLIYAGDGLWTAQKQAQAERENACRAS
jgi:chloramphenicol-sensitive protein RarD